VAVVQTSAVSGEHLFQQSLALGKRCLAQIVAVEIEQIEGEKDLPVVLFFREGRLHRLKAARAVGFQNDRLAVENGARDREFLDRAGNRGETIGPVELAARQKPRLAPVQPAEQTVAVELDLMQPVFVTRWLRDEERQLWQYRARHRAAMR